MFQPCPGMFFNGVKHGQFTRAKADMGLGRAMIFQDVQFEFFTVRNFQILGFVLLWISCSSSVPCFLSTLSAAAGE